MKAVVTVVGKDRVGIVYEVSKLLAEQNINIVNISQEIMDEYFTMLILVDVSTSKMPFVELAPYIHEQGKNLALDIRIQNHESFEAMHRIG
ncbi:ACT domain-containing protein [Granulicatella sp.]